MLNQDGPLRVQIFIRQLGRRLGIKQGPEMTCPRKTFVIASEESRETGMLSQNCQPACCLKDERYALRLLVR
jgi:hypothetical protein